MKLIIFGASGRVGKELVLQALVKGHNVTAFVRDANKLPFEHASLRKVEGNVLNEQQVSEAITGQDAVLVALGEFKPNGPVTLMSEAAKNILAAMKQHGVKRIIGIGGAGVLQDNEISLRKDRADFPSFLTHVSNDHLKVFLLYENGEAQWTFVCPPNITDGGATGVYRLRLNYHPKDGIAIRTGDVAHFMLHELEANKYLNNRVGIAY